MLLLVHGLTACAGDGPATPRQLAPTAPSLDVDDDGDGVTTFGCPTNLPAPGSNPVVFPGATRIPAVIKPGLMRTFDFPLPWQYDSRRSATVGQLCIYTHSTPGTTVAEDGLPSGDWAVSNGFIILRSVAFRRNGNWLGLMQPIGYQGGHFTRTTPENEPAPEACDDPMTEIEEEYPNCATTPQGAYGGGASHDDVVWYSPPPSGGGGAPRYMCTVTDWYQWSGSEWVYTDTIVDWDSCRWE